MKKAIVLGAASLAALIGATGVLQAHRGDWRAWGEERSVAVSVAGLDLSTDEGVELLERRIARAVDRICGSSGRSFYGYGSSWSDDRDCREDAWRSTELQVERAIARAEYRRQLAWEREQQMRAQVSYQEPPRYAEGCRTEDPCQPRRYDPYDGDDRYGY